MKARLNLILSLLLIAITISLIAVSFGWYAAEAGEVYFEDSSVTIKTADGEFYYGGANFEFVKTMSRTDKNATTFTVHDNIQPYYGQDGIFNGEYVLLLKMEKNGADAEGNPLSNNGYPYIASVGLYLQFDDDCDYETKYTSTSDYMKDFEIMYVDYTEGSKTATIIERQNNEVCEYIAIVFGNGSSIFKYSSNQYLGYKFIITLDYYNKVEE